MHEHDIPKASVVADALEIIFMPSGVKHRRPAEWLALHRIKQIYPRPKTPNLDVLSTPRTTD